MNLRSFLTGVLMITALSSCSFYRIDSEEISMNFYPPKNSPEEVAYVEAVTQPHEVIGYVTVNTERIQALDDVIPKLKREAAVLGGDAITNIQENASGLWKKIPPQKLLGNAYIRANYTATVVAYQ